MKTNNVRKCLREASESIQCAADAADEPGVKSQLVAIADQLQYFVEGDSTDPEAEATPRPDTLDTIQSKLTGIMEEGDDDVTEHLREARKQLLLTIVTLDDRRRKQHRSFAESKET